MIAAKRFTLNFKTSSKVVRLGDFFYNDNTKKIISLTAATNILLVSLISMPLSFSKGNFLGSLVSLVSLVSHTAEGTKKTSNQRDSVFEKRVIDEL